MAATILLCVAGFVVIYAQVDPLTRDFIGAPATATVTREAGQAAGGSASNSNQDEEETPERTATAEPTEEPEPTPTEEEGFVPTHLSNTTDTVNFRSGPGTDFGVVDTMSPGTPLRATGESGVAGDSLTWLEFETEDGTIGWIREIDSVPQD